MNNAATAPGSTSLPAHLIAHINVKLAHIGCQPVPLKGDAEFAEIAATMAGQSREKDRLLGHYLCPLDQDQFTSGILSSYRVANGVLHNPRSDRRTTQGIFHVTEGGLPIPDDKLGVPKITFAKMLALALNPPREIMRLPFTATQPKPAECFVSLLLRPIVCPEVPGFTSEKRMEVRFFVPGNLVSNLDFVESIFGNAGDPILPENDSALDAEHWTGHTGCVILAPHLVKVPKKEVGLPSWDNATERQRRDSMCWRSDGELYN